MIPPITREEHYFILNKTEDGIGYCLEMFNMKTGRNMKIGQFAMQLKVWVAMRTRKRMGMMDGAEHIKKHFSEKFA